MAPALEGFYFDSCKKKYFRILPNHLAPKGATYSEQAIKEQEEKQKAEELESREAQSGLRIQASPVLLHPLLGASGIRRETGRLGRFAVVDAMNAAWAWGLKRQTLYTNTIQSSGLPREITAFARDDATGGFVYGLFGQSNEQNAIYACLRGSAMEGPMRLNCSPQSQVTSISMSPSRVFIATTLGGPYPAEFHITKLLSPDDFRQFMDDNTLPSNAYEYTLLGSKPQVQWSSASVPDATSAVFAIGSNDQVTFIKDRQSHWDQATIEHPKVDAFSVDWLSQDVLMSGNSAGGVGLWDIRVRGVATRFNFHSSINHSRKLNEHQVVVSGNAESIRIYDLRYLAAPDPHEGTPPRMVFPTFRRYNYSPFCGFDVCGNLIAAANRDCQVQMFDAGSGKELKIGQSKTLPAWGYSMDCLRFGEALDGSGLRLYTTVDNCLKEWGWFDLDENGE